MPLRRALGLALLAGSFALFALAAAPGIYWLDSGELSAAAASLGIAHPTGFPLFCLLGKAATLVPLGDLAFRVNLLSALCAATTVRLLYGIGTEWLGEGATATLGAAAGALVPALGLTFFRQATVAEVYAPSALVLVLGLGLLVRLARAPRRLVGLALALLAGLALGVHAQLRWLLVAPSAFVLLALALRGRAGAWIRLAPALAVIGGGILLYLPVRAAAPRPPAANWGAPRTLGRLLDEQSAGRIRRAFRSEMLSRQPRVVLHNARRFAALTTTELGPLVPLVALVGLVALLRRRPLAGLCCAFVGTLDAAYAIWVNPMGIDDLQNGVPLHLVMGLGAGAGVAWLGERLGRRAGPAAAAAVAVCMLVPTLVAELGSKLGNSDGAARLLDAVLFEAPPRGAVLAVSDDVNAGLTWARAVGERPDVVGLPQQHLWDRALVDAVLARAGAGPPPLGEAELVRHLLGRGGVLWQDGPDLPPPPLALAPAAPLPRLVAEPSTGAQPPGEMLHAAQAACDGILGDPMGQRACAALFVGIGSTLYRAGDALRARAMLEVALRLWPEDAAASVDLGVVRAAQGDPAGGAALEERALALDPANYAAAVNAGRYRLAAGELEAAERAFERARALRPQAAVPLAGLGVTLARMGRLDEGRHLGEEAARRDPAHPEVRAALRELGLPLPR